MYDVYVAFCAKFILSYKPSVILLENNFYPFLNSSRLYLEITKIVNYARVLTVSDHSSTSFHQPTFNRH